MLSLNRKQHNNNQVRPGSPIATLLLLFSVKQAGHLNFICMCPKGPWCSFCSALGWIERIAKYVVKVVLTRHQMACQTSPDVPTFWKPTTLCFRMSLQDGVIHPAHPYKVQNLGNLPVLSSHINCNNLDQMSSIFLNKVFTQFE